MWFYDHEEGVRMDYPAVSMVQFEQQPSDHHVRGGRHPGTSLNVVAEKILFGRMWSKLVRVNMSMGGLAWGSFQGYLSAARWGSTKTELDQRILSREFFDNSQWEVDGTAPAESNAVCRAGARASLSNLRDLKRRIVAAEYGLKVEQLQVYSASASTQVELAEEDEYDVDQDVEIVERKDSEKSAPIQKLNTVTKMAEGDELHTRTDDLANFRLYSTNHGRDGGASFEVKFSANSDDETMQEDSLSFDHELFKKFKQDRELFTYDCDSEEVLVRQNIWSPNAHHFLSKFIQKSQF